MHLHQILCNNYTLFDKSMYHKLWKLCSVYLWTIYYQYIMRQVDFPNWKASKRTFTEERNYYQLQWKFDLGIIYIELLHAILKCSQLLQMKVYRRSIWWIWLTLRSCTVFMYWLARETGKSWVKQRIGKKTTHVHKNGYILM